MRGRGCSGGVPWKGLQARSSNLTSDLSASIRPSPLLGCLLPSLQSRQLLRRTPISLAASINRKSSLQPVSCPSFQDQVGKSPIYDCKSGSSSEKSRTENHISKALRKLAVRVCVCVCFQPPLCPPSPVTQSSVLLQL